jgi:hypothetical protein
MRLMSFVSWLGESLLNHPFEAESTMADQARDPNQSKTKPEPKKPETVLLTPEELRAISGGTSVLPPQPVRPTDVTSGQ